MAYQRTVMVEHCPDRLAPLRQPHLGKGRKLMRQCVLLAVTAIILVNCSGSDKTATVGQLDYLQGFIGGVAADEPRAALVARDILSAGGSAADAVAAAALTYAVTHPGGGGPGGGGVCVVGQADKRQGENIELPALAAAGLSAVERWVRIGRGRTGS